MLVHSTQDFKRMIKQQKIKNDRESPYKIKNDRERFFSISSRRLAESVDGLDSSPAQSPGELWPTECEPIYGLSRSLKGARVN